MRHKITGVEPNVRYRRVRVHLAPSVKALHKLYIDARRQFGRKSRTCKDHYNTYRREVYRIAKYYYGMEWAGYIRSGY